MKHRLMSLAGLPITLFFRLGRPFSDAWKRIYTSAQLKAKVRSMDFTVQCDGQVHVTGTRNIRLGKRCRLGMEVELQANDQGVIQIGDDVRINRGCTLVAYTRIVIGDFTLIGEFVSIRDANHGMQLGSPMRFQPHTTAAVEIGSDVWIGRGACILPGITIGNGSVIGANSVVTRSIPDFAIAAGIPAVIIKERK